MRKLIMSLVVAVMMAVSLLLSASPAAADPLPDNCFKERGTVYCVVADPPGNNQGGVVKTETFSKKGSLQSSHEKEDEGSCVVNNGGTHCK